MSLSLVAQDFHLLSKEAGRRHADVRDAADKALHLVKLDPSSSSTSTDPTVLYQPVFLASQTRNQKVIALAVSALQRLITTGIVPSELVGKVLDTLEQVLPQGVEIQLKILQTLVSLLTTTVLFPNAPPPPSPSAPSSSSSSSKIKGHPLVVGPELGRALELSHRLSTSKIPVVASTASATLRQLFMFVYERISDEDELVRDARERGQLEEEEELGKVRKATFDVDLPPSEVDRAKDVVVVVSPGYDSTTRLSSDERNAPASANDRMRSIKLRPAARDAYLLLEDLCLLISAGGSSTNSNSTANDGGNPYDGEPSFLRWSSLSRTFGLELVESIVSGFGTVVRTHPELLLVLRAHLCPLLIRFLSSPPSPHASSHSTSTTTTTGSTSSGSLSLSTHPPPSSSFSFPLTLRLTRVVFLLLKHFSDLLTLESEIFLTMFVRVLGPASNGQHGEGGHPAGGPSGTSPLWMRVLALEIFRGLCGDFELMVKFYQRYDAAQEPSSKSGGGGSTVFSDLMSAFNRLATERPSALGTGHAVLYGSSLTPPPLGVDHHSVQHHGSTGSVSTSNLVSGSSTTAGGGGGGSTSTTGSTMIDSAMEMGYGLAQAAGSVVGSGASALTSAATSSTSHLLLSASSHPASSSSSGSIVALLSTSTASMKLQCIDQLDKAEPPPIPETYIFLLAVQCLVAVSDGFREFTLGTFGRVVEEERDKRDKGQVDGKGRTRDGQATVLAPAALDWDVLDASVSPHGEERDGGGSVPDRVEDPKITSLRIVKHMAETSWPALLASLSFFLATSLSDDLFTDVVASLESFTCVCGVLNLSTPREAFLTSLCKFAIPPAVVSYIASQDSVSNASSSTRFSASATAASAAAATATAVLSAGAESLGLTSSSSPLSSVSSSSSAGSNPVGLSSRNLACLRALLSCGNYLAGSLGKTWFSVFEALQNADFVLRTTAASRGKRKVSSSSSSSSASSTTPGTPALGSTKGKGGSSSTATSTGPGSSESLEPTSKFPAVPTEQEEQAVQRGIAALFEVSKSLDDKAFTEFAGALCRLNGEMIGIAMNDDGTVKGGGDDAGAGVKSPIDTPEKNRRRSSGISTKSSKMVEKSFGISKLGVISLFNVQRLVYRDPTLGWSLITSHLLLVLHATLVPTTIRLQAADVLDSLLILAPKTLAAAPPDIQRRAQLQVLSVLASQAEPAARLQTSTDVDIRRMALETLLKILETNGHAFTVGWDRIFHVLRTACPTSQFFAPPSPQPPSHSEASRRSLDTIVEADRIEPMTPLRLQTSGSYFGSSGPGTELRTPKTSVLVRTSFPCLQLICSDFLGGLELDDLRDCIGTLAEFGKQAEDVNVALTAGGLLWSVSDHVQAKRKDGQDERGHGDLWMFLLHRLLGLCRDPRQEVRDAAITNIFRSISMYGTTLSKETWDACCWEIVFPLVEDVTASVEVQAHSRPDSLDEREEQTVPQANGPPIRLVDKQWDDSKTLVLRSMGDVFFDYLPQIVKTSRYEETWEAFVGHLKQSFVRDRPTPATAAMQALEKVLTVSLESTEASRIASSWETAWTAWDEIGSAIEANTAASDSAKVFTQVNLEAFVRVLLPIYTPPYISFPLSRITRLLSVLKAVLRYSRSPDYRPDIDGLMPLQSAVLEVVAVIKLDEVPGAASAVLSDLADYLTFAFVAPLGAQPGGLVNGRSRPSQSVTYIALTKEVMPHVLWLFQKYRDDPSIYEQGAVERMLTAYALPMRLKHDCPAPAKFGSAEPLWKSATVNFLRGVRDVVASFRAFGQELPAERFVGIWTAIVAGFRGALLAETGTLIHESLDDVYREENFDLALLLSLEQDVLPHVGATLVPDELICTLGKTLQLASRLYELEVPRIRQERVLATKRSFASSLNVQDAYTPPPTPPEPRFDPDFDRQAKANLHGTTVEVVEHGRERFAFWSFDLLFSLCSAEQHGDERDRRRIAALCLPSLLNRCASTIKTYVADAPLRGKMPFPRIRQEELVYILQKLFALRLAEGTLWASTQSSPSKAIDSPDAFDPSLPLSSMIRSILLRSPAAHLYEFHSLLVALLSVVQTTSPSTTASLPYRFAAGQAEDGQDLEGLPHGFPIVGIGKPPAEPQEVDIVKLVLGCLAVVGSEIGAGSSF
ncbi:hypothetical protein JCM10212_006237 [Sporobolomyces blumeae]